jgi:hypothetical protein
VENRFQNLPFKFNLQRYSAVNPSGEHHDETINSLQFAHRRGLYKLNPVERPTA